MIVRKLIHCPKRSRYVAHTHARTHALKGMKCFCGGDSIIFFPLSRSLHFCSKGNAHVIYNGSFYYYCRDYGGLVVRYDLISQKEEGMLHKHTRCSLLVLTVFHLFVLNDFSEMNLKRAYICRMWPPEAIISCTRRDTIMSI